MLRDASPEGAFTEAFPGDASGDAPEASRACAAAGDPSDGAPPLPLGVYTQCSGSVVDSNATAAGSPTGTLTLIENDAGLTVTLGDGLLAIAPGALAFTPLTSAAAIVAPGQSYGIVDVPCAMSTVAAGALARDGNSLVIAILGEGCGSAIGGFVACPLPAQASGELEGAGLCDDDGGAQAFPLGTYVQCTSSIPGYGEGSVILSQSQGNGVWTAALDGVTGISSVGPTLTISPSSSSAALIGPGQMLLVEESGWGTSCSGSTPNDSGLPGLPVLITRTVTIESGWLVIDGSTLFVFVGGTDECGAAVTESFNCAAQ
jgi:hypothetical protein